MDTDTHLVRELIPSDEGNTFVYKQEDFIWPVWHYHEEIDILLFLASSGQHVTGDYMGTFEPGTLLVNGPNVPHGFTSTPKPPDSPSEPAIIVLQFSEKTIGPGLMAKSEMSLIRDFIRSTQRSYEFFGETREKVAELMHQLEHSQHALRLSQFIQLLEILALAPEHDKHMLVSEYYSPVLNQQNVNRIEKVRQWVLKNLEQKITLEEAASQIQMPPKSFSYFFKKNTGKAFVQYVKELRIGLACQQLLHSERSILEICHSSGFNNLSNFNRQFLQVKAMTPRAFRKQFQQLTHPNT